MTVDFHKDMGNYLTKRRKRKVFSAIKSKIMNKKAVVSYKATDKFGEFKGKLSSKVEEIKKKRREPKKEITQGDVEELVKGQGIKGGPSEKVEMTEEKEEGWTEVNLEELKGNRGELGSLEDEKKGLQESLAKVEEKERTEKQRIARLSEENEQREKVESEEDKLKRLELEEEVKILKEKQKIEEDRLSELKRARRIEQMDSLKGRVSDILFKKRPKKQKDMVEEVRKDIRTEAKIEAAERQRAEGSRPKEDVAKVDTKPKPKEDVVKVEEGIDAKKKELEKVEEKKKDIEKKPKKSFLSNFIQIRTAKEMAKEEEERLKSEEEQALRDQSEVSKLFQEEGVEVKTNVPDEGQGPNLSTLFPAGQEGAQKEVQNSDNVNIPAGEQGPNLSTLFPGAQETEQKQEQDSDRVFVTGEESDISTLLPEDKKTEQKQTKDSDNVIELDQGYKIRVVKNE